MGTMGPLLAEPLLAGGGVPGVPSVPGVPQEAFLQGYRACLQQALHRLVEQDGTPTSDPRVLTITNHLCRRQASLELEQELRRRAPPLEGAAVDLSRHLLADYFRGVDLHYTASAWDMAR